MRLTGVTVCVDYADLLAVGLRGWHTGVDRLVVVTAPKDKATIALCRFHNVETYITDIFYANGAHFNKGAALAEAFASKRLREDADGWLLTFDADMVPCADWRLQLERLNLQPGTLYGAWRYEGRLTRDGTLDTSRGRLMLVQRDGRPTDQRRVGPHYVTGFFMLFHALDPVLPATGPLFDLHWSHAGNYDSNFTERWPRAHWRALELDLRHLGDERCNWAGRYKPEVMSAIFKGGGDPNRWQREKMVNPPKLPSSLAVEA